MAKCDADEQIVSRAGIGVIGGHWRPVRGFFRGFVKAAAGITTIRRCEFPRGQRGPSRAPQIKPGVLESITDQRRRVFYPLAHLSNDFAAIQRAENAPLP